MGTRTALFSRNQPGGIFTITDESFTTGDRWFVDSATGTDAAGYGVDPDKPVATIDYAIGLCTADKGDIIYVMPKHAESVASATGCVCDIAGITIKGLSANPYLMPKLTLDTANTAKIDITAAGVTLENLWLEMNFADIAGVVNVAATDCTLRGIRFIESTTNMNAKVAIVTGAAAASNRLTVENCFAQMPDAANTHFINIPGTPDGLIIRNNVLHGDWGTMALGGAGICTNIAILDNLIAQLASTADSCVNLAATATGVVARNLCCGAAAQANGITATACAVAENYYGVISEDLSAILDPIAT
ncbi:MAG: hypothetical protein IMY86_13985 [Chloroflexi bacterium]|nr:hypothetical protein [Chloroflexota bacterium]